MDIFKLFFEHDLRLDKLKQRHTTNEPETELSIEDFMTPDPTFSKFYLTGTRIDKQEFGLNVLNHFSEILDRLDHTFSGEHFFSSDQTFDRLSEGLDRIAIGEALIISPNSSADPDLSQLQVGDDSNVGHIKEQLSGVLSDGFKVLYKEKAHHGYDLHLFSKKNIYPSLFHPLQELLTEERNLRFFSINSKRIQSERKFYFETWTLENPPHGAEEVHPETVL